jgi:flavin-dependent dehydrogenase
VAYRYASADKVKLKAKVAMIDKPLFIEDMLDEAHPLNPSEANLTTFDRIIDATGFKRAYLSPYPSPLIIKTIQIRAVIEPPSFPTAIMNNGGGYTWIFPIGKSEAHVGSVSFQGIEFARRVLDELTKKINVERIICSCEEQVRCHGPVVPFIEGKVWGLGEAIGLVDPISGIGILPAMTSAKLLLENWDNPRKYESRVRAKYSYITREVNILSKFSEGRLPGYRELFCLWPASRNTGLSIGPREIINMLALALRVRKGSAGGFYH